MNIKNYTSTVDASCSMVRIQELLVKIYATNINKQYIDNVCIGPTFLLSDLQLQQTLAFHLKTQWDECFTILWKEIKLPQENTRISLKNQTSKTVCKILSEWMEMQCGRTIIPKHEISAIINLFFVMSNLFGLYNRPSNEQC